MRDILEGLYNTETEEGKKKSQWCSFLFYLCLLASFVISCFASYKASKGYLNKTLFTYKFPMQKGENNFPAGTPVSLDWEGYVQRGAGFGIYRNVTVVSHEVMRGLKTEVVGEHIIVSAYYGKVSLQYIDGDDVTYPMEFNAVDERGVSVTVSHLIQLNDTKLILVGNNRMIPLTVSDNYDGKHHTLSCVFGQPNTIAVSENSIFPHVDNLDGNHVAFIYEDHSNYRLMAGYGTWTGEGEQAKIQFKGPFVASEEGFYSYHGVAGLRRDKFLIAATGHKNNGTVVPEPFAPIRVKVASIDHDRETITFSDWNIRVFSDNVNWFALDNFNSQMAVICYYDETEGNGVVGMAIFLDGDHVRFGGYTIIESGGALKPESHTQISLRILSDRRFGVMFPDASANGNLIFMMGERTDNNDITRVGSNFVIARNGRRQSGTFTFAVGAVDWSRFVLVDSYIMGDNSYSSVNVGYHLAYPVGITTDRSKSSKYIQFHGVYKYNSLSKALVPGYTYYTNSKGELIRGRPYGYNHAEFGQFYVVSSETYEICALHNQIGIAVSEKELLIRTY